MTFRVLSLFACLCLFLTLPACAEEQSRRQQGTVTWVYDGDTLKIEPFGKVRLLGIDSPERENSRRDSYLEKKGVTAAKQRQIYQAAKAFNIEHVKGRKVDISLGNPPRDKHDRLLAYIDLPDGRLLNIVLLEEGLAVVYRRFDFALKETFLAAETRARHAEKGLWQGSSSSGEKP